MEGLRQAKNEYTTYVFHSYDIQNLEGKLLTFIEASVADQEQRRATKDIVRQMVWNWAFENNKEDLYSLESKFVGGVIGSATSASNSDLGIIPGQF